MTDNKEVNTVIRDYGFDDEGEHVFKICVVGEPAVGKTSLIRKFVKDQFETKHIKTIGVDISKQPVKLEGGVNVNLLFWDIAGQIQFHLLHKVYLQGVMGVIIAFDLTRPKTLVNVESWYTILKNYVAHKVPIILAGNKADLDNERQVGMPSIKQQQDKLGINTYVETSALDGRNISKLFQNIAKMVYDTKK